MSNNTMKWTIITAVLTVFVYIDGFYLWDIFYITIPLAVLSSIIAMIVTYKELRPVYMLLNVLFTFIAIVAFFVLNKWPYYDSYQSSDSYHLLIHNTLKLHLKQRHSSVVCSKSWKIYRFVWKYFGLKFNYSFLKV